MDNFAKRINIVVFAVLLSLFLFSCGEISKTAEYTITYHGNKNTSGYPPVDKNKYTSGSYAAVLDKNTLQREGYKFGGWNTKPDYSGEQYESGSSIKIKNRNIFLHAVWNE